MDLPNYFLNSFLNSWLAIGAVAILFFLLIREVVTWYWKMNDVVNLLEKIEKNTRREELNTKSDK